MVDASIRQLTSQDEFDSCVALQMETWRYTDTEVFPRRIFLIASRIGGQVMGAFQGQQMVGFTLAMPAYRDGRAYLHSQMLAVSSDARNAGIGMRLKLAQRQIALEQGFDLIEWTYDPLEIKNAYLNLVKLGAVCSEAGDGSEALTLLRHHAGFDLMLVDVNMPVMNGLECVRCLREEKLNPAMKVMMVTTEADNLFIEQALEYGADEFLMKPFTPQSLREKLLLLGFAVAA